jgi:hypothetical protein
VQWLVQTEIQHGFRRYADFFTLGEDLNPAPAAAPAIAPSNVPSTAPPTISAVRRFLPMPFRSPCWISQDSQHSDQDKTSSYPTPVARLQSPGQRAKANERQRDGLMQAELQE